MYWVLLEQDWAEQRAPSLFPFLTHAERPVEHDVVPVSHTFPVLQLWFGVHAPHVPPWQYMFVPHDWLSLPEIVAQVPPGPAQF